MKHYLIIENNIVTGHVQTNGAVVDPRYVEIDPAQINPGAMIGRAYDDGQYNEVPQPRLETVADFISRFTDDELGDIETLAQSNKRARGWVQWLKLQMAVDLDHPRITGAVQLMETAGVIGAGRAAEILS